MEPISKLKGQNAMNNDVSGGEQMMEMYLAGFRPRTNASRPQPPPTPGHGRVLDYVLADMAERAESGKQKYGTYLEVYNGRDPLWDAYQEALDLVMYLRQALLERDSANSKGGHTD